MMMMMMGHPFGMLPTSFTPRTQYVESESEPDFLVVSVVLIDCDHILLVLPVCMLRIILGFVCLFKNVCLHTTLDISIVVFVVDLEISASIILYEDL